MLVAPESLKIKTMRKALGMSRRALCERAGISESTLQKIESGCNAQAKTIKLIARVLGCDYRSLGTPRRLLTPGVPDGLPTLSSVRLSEPLGAALQVS